LLMHSCICRRPPHIRRRSAHNPTRITLFLNDTATTEISPLSLHDALPISVAGGVLATILAGDMRAKAIAAASGLPAPARSDFLRSEEHTSELQSLTNLVCRLLLEKKKTQPPTTLSRRPPPLSHTSVLHHNT